LLDAGTYEQVTNQSSIGAFEVKNLIYNTSGYFEIDVLFHRCNETDQKHFYKPSGNYKD